MKSKIAFLSICFAMCVFLCACQQNVSKSNDTNNTNNSSDANKFLTYSVDPNLDFNSDYDMSSFEKANELESKIVSHVENSVSDMNKIFDKKKVSIEDYGAKASTEESIDFVKTNTKAIYKAICDVSKDGGTVIVPAGKTFYTSAIHLENNVNLHIDNGATLKFCKDTNLYIGDFMKEVYGDGVDDKGLTFTRYESVECMNYSPFIYAYGIKESTNGGEVKMMDDQNCKYKAYMPSIKNVKIDHLTVNGKILRVMAENTLCKLGDLTNHVSPSLVKLDLRLTIVILQILHLQIQNFMALLKHLILNM